MSAPSVVPRSADVDISTYLAHWTVDQADVLRRDVEQQVTAWLRDRPKTRSWDPTVDRPGRYVGPNGEELTVIHHESSQGVSTQFRLVEDDEASQGTGTWRTVLTAHEPRHGQSWIVLRVSNNRGFPAKPPRLATHLLDALRLYDGGTWMSSSPQRYHRHDAETVADEVTNIDRRGLYFVMGTSEELPINELMKATELWVQDTRGLAQVAVLGPEATRRFNEILGPSHAVAPATLRTYLPDTDPAVPGDSLRHRVLGTARLAGPAGWVRNRLGRAARTHAAEHPPPPAVRAVLRTLSRVHDREFIERLTESTARGPVTRADTIEADAAAATPDTQTLGPLEAPDTATPAPIADEGTAAPEADAVADAAAEYLAQLQLVKDFFGVDTLDAPTLEQAVRSRRDAATDVSRVRVAEELQSRQDAIEELEFELALVRDANEVNEIELTLAQEDRAKAEDEIRWLRQRIAQMGDRDAYSPIPREHITPHPESFSDLVDLLPQLEAKGVIFTDDTATVMDLDDHDQIGRVARVTWECLLALADYVRARNNADFDGGLTEYLESTPSGYRTVSPSKYASRESKTVRSNRGMADERIFRVPTTVDPSGRTRMVAHFRLAKLATVSPRMYVYDNWTTDGKVYVGYIGRHLTNTLTT